MQIWQSAAMPMATAVMIASVWMDLFGFKFLLLLVFMPSFICFNIL